jgi:probable addiction module antidote protein
MTKITKFEASDYLDSEEAIAEYLNACLEEGGLDLFLVGIGDAAKARGMAEIARTSGLGRESLYKALAPGAHPRHETVLKVIHALGLKMTFTPLATP